MPHSSSSSRLTGIALQSLLQYLCCQVNHARVTAGPPSLQRWWAMVACSCRGGSRDLPPAWGKMWKLSNLYGFSPFRFPAFVPLSFSSPSGIKYQHRALKPLLELWLFSWLCSDFLSESNCSPAGVLSKNCAIHSVNVMKTLKKMTFQCLFFFFFLKGCAFWMNRNVCIWCKLLEKEKKRISAFCLVLFCFLIRVELLCNNKSVWCYNNFW